MNMHVVILTACIDHARQPHGPRRETNEVAHILAKYAFENEVSISWVDEPPDLLVNAIVNDVTILPVQ